MQTLYLGNSPEQALEVSRSLYPSAASLTVIDEGQENLIIVIDHELLMRFPRSEEIWQRGKAEREALRLLASLPMVPVPHLTRISEEPAYVVATYLHGKQITTTELRSLPVEVLERIGSEIATFAYSLHTQLPVKTFQPLIEPPSWSYDDYLKRVLYDRQDPDPRIDALAKEYFHKWQAKHTPSRKVVAHDDLHMGNLLFDDTYHLTGVLDFGAICIGTAEQDLRQTFRLGEAGFEAAIATYEQLSGKELDRETAKLWTITQELASYCREDSDTVHERARENLQFWFPEIFT